MDLGFYEIDAWGEQLTGACAPQRCALSGVAKRNSPDAPYAVANEFVCARLGLLIGLPVPPGAVVSTDDGKLGYVSLRFGPKGKPPPPLNPQEFVEDNPSTTGCCSLRLLDRQPGPPRAQPCLRSGRAEDTGDGFRPQPRASRRASGRSGTTIA
jgi:hypothetical protein